ncbi:hypothetical protein M5K25_009543 [Dendrobium thyrsiflorum]|uniref:Uncharacterized protein n=1 Tax=Dendrobium thyrsiflorum TaxID=117978 RepID=A0ABD0VD26_DENTH
MEEGERQREAGLFSCSGRRRCRTYFGGFAISDWSLIVFLLMVLLPVNYLLKKAFELSVLYDTEVGVIIVSPQGKVHEFASTSMQNVMERYKMNLLDLSSNCSATEQNIQHWKQEAALNAMNIDFLEASKRLMGENLESCSLEDLNKFEGQLEKGLGNIRGIKTRLLSQQVTQLEEKTRVLSEENELLQNQCKETQLTLDSTRLVALQDNNNQHKDVETDLYIGCPGRGKI